VERALNEAGIPSAQVQILAIGLGPGSYTGIRVALAMAQGWQLANAIEVRGVSSAWSLAQQAAEQGRQGRLAVAIDAQRGEFYLGQWNLVNGAATETQPLRIVSRDDVQRVLDAGVPLTGPDLAKVFPAAHDRVPEAATLGKLARSVPGQPAELWEPIYLRETKFVKAPPARVIG
jgi:tRNA threonylcarbamoyl adenosine modification protein YeaZ